MRRPIILNPWLNCNFVKVPTMCLARAFDAFQMVWHLNLLCQEHFGENCQIVSVTKKTAWPKMIAHKMPQALLVLSHVQSAIRFVSFLHFCFQLSWLIIVEKVGCLASNLNRKDWWEFIWNAWEPMSTKIRSCRCGNRSLLSLQRFLWTLDYANTYENSKTCVNEKLLLSEEIISIFKCFFLRW